MPALAEISANLNSRLQEEFSETSQARLVEPLTPTIVEGASIEKATKFDQEDNWQESASHYFTLLTEGETATEKSEGLIGLSQIFINHGEYDRAGEILSTESVDLLKEMKGRERNLFEARISEKRGWIFDYYGDFEQAKREFLLARSVIEQLQVDERSEIEESVFSTTTHFLGRAHFGLASQGNEREENLREAENYFRQDLQRAVSFRTRGNPIPANEGFQYLWIARVNILRGDYYKAEMNAEQARRLFEEYTETNTKSGIFGHYFKLKGMLAFEREAIPEAKGHFDNSLDIWTGVQLYPKGQSDALYGLALCDYAEGNRQAAVENGTKALQINPYLLKRGFI